MYGIAMTISPTEVHYGHHPSGSWSGGRAISCDVAGRSGLLRTRSGDLQILPLLGERLEDKATLTLS